MRKGGIFPKPSSGCPPCSRKLKELNRHTFGLAVAHILQRMFFTGVVGQAMIWCVLDAIKCIAFLIKIPLKV